MTMLVLRASNGPYVSDVSGTLTEKNIKIHFAGKLPGAKLFENSLELLSFYHCYVAKYDVEHHYEIVEVDIIRDPIRTL